MFDWLLMVEVLANAYQSRQIANTSLTGLVQAEQVQSFLGIWHLVPVLFQGVYARISTQKIVLKWEPGHSSSLSPAPNNTTIVSWLCVPSALSWIGSVPEASTISDP